MINKESRKIRRGKRHTRIRKSVSGTQERPRLSFFRSNKHFYAQIIDDTKGHTLISCSTVQPTFQKESKITWKKDSAQKLGEITAKTAKEKGIGKVVFDRGGFLFKGKVLAFAEGARKAGLEF